MSENIELNKAEHELNNIKFIDIDKIGTNQLQPRKSFNDETIKELSVSIKNHGILQPLLVKKIDNNKFVLIAGERRLRASRIAGLSKIPCILRDETEEMSFELGIIENLQREDLNSVEQARGFLRLMKEYQYSFESLGKRVGKNKTTIQNYVRLLDLQKEILDGLEKQLITTAHGKSLLSLDNKPKKQLQLFNKTIEESLSVKQLDVLIAKSKRKKEKKNARHEKPDMRYICDQIKGFLGTKVTINGDETNGRIEIAYFSAEDLNRVVDIILGNSIFYKKKSK